jgi:ATP-dependent DNA helicase RecQ
MLRVPPPARARRDRAARGTAQPQMAEGDRTLFQALRQKRLDIARAQNVPPYVVFHDKTLMELAAARPSSRAEMAGVPGVGEAKLDRYGPAFLSVIAEHA